MAGNPLTNPDFDKEGKNHNPEVQRPGEHGQPINPLELSQKVNDRAPVDAMEANQRLQRDNVEQAQAKGTANAHNARTFEDNNGNKINALVETRANGTQHVYQDNGKGGWSQSQLLTDNHGRQYLQPLDNQGNPDRRAQVTELRNPSSDAGNNRNNNAVADSRPGQQTEQNRRADAPQTAPLQGHIETNVNQGKPGAKPDAPHEAIAAKPQDPGKHTEGLNEQAAKAAKPNDTQHMQIDGKLLAQLNTFRMDGFHDSRLHLADMIGKFQDGKFHATGRDAELFQMFKGMKPEQLNGLHNWLKDGTKFDFRSLDMKTQQGISHIFDHMLDRGEGKVAGRMVDLLGDRFRGFEKVPTADQSRAMMMEFFKGARDAQTMSARDAGATIANLISRTMLADRGDFKTSALDSSVQSILNSRLQSRELLASNISGDRIANNAVSRPDSVTQLVGQIRDDNRISGMNLSDGARAMLLGQDGTPITRGLTPADQQLVRTGDQTSGPRAGTDQNEMPLEAKPTGMPSDKSNPLDSSESKKKKEDEENAAISAMSQKDRFDKEDQQRKLEDEKEKLEKEEKEERLRKLEEEKQKEEEERRKQQEDPEFTYTVSGEQETLVKIAAKYSGRTAEHIYARNINDIMLKEHKGKKYAVLYVGQKLIIPNNQWIDNYRTSMQSYGHIGFDGIPYESAEEELISRFGEKWSAGAGAASAFGQQKRLFSDKDDDKPVTRRSFSGKGPLSEDERKENIKQGLGLNSANADSQQAKYTVKLGQQLRSIAQKLYGDPQFWRLLASKNELSTDTDHKGEPLAQLKKGQQLLLPSAQEVDAFKAAHLRKHVEPAQESEEAFVEQMVPIELQEITITDDESAAMDFSPQENEIVPQAQEQTAVTSTHTTQHPIPHAEYTKVEVGFEETEQEADPLWTARIDAVQLDQFVQIVEAEIYVSDTRGLRVSLQLLHSGQWVTIYDYEIFPDETLIHQYKRTGGRTTTRRSLPANKTKELASNHFQNAWQSLCREYWRS